MEPKKGLTNIGKDIVDDINHKEIPKIMIPSRSTSNIRYDPEFRCFVLGDQETTRSVGNIRHVKKFAQLLKVSRYCKEDLLSADKHSTLRELYYYSENWGKDLKFDEQKESNDMIEDMETILEIPREYLKIVPEERGSVYGDLVVEYTDPRGKIRKVNCLDSPEGMSIGPKLDESKILKVNAKRVIAIETGGMYGRLIEEGAFDKFNSILVHLGGQSTRSARLLLKRLHEEFHLPIHIFADNDPWGMHIAMVIISGSANAAHINKRLAVPDAKWIGLSPSDVKKYNLRTDKLSKTDVKRIKELMSDPRYKGEMWQKELTLMLNMGVKAEQQALSRHGLSFVVDNYLPEKLKIFEK